MVEEFAVQVKNISKSFPGVKALSQVSFDVRKGTVHALVGENGAGKSTLMKILNGVYRPDEGEIFINHKKESITSPIQARELGISMIYQELVYVPDISIAENLCLGRQPVNRLGLVEPKSMYAAARKIMEEENISINPKTTMREIRLSDAQMIEIVKATTEHASIFIMDEPTSSLTLKESERLFTKIRQLREQGCTIIYISHKMEEIFQLSDYITIMRDGQSIKTAPIDEFTEEDIVAMMVGRKVENIYPTRSAKPGKTIFEVKNLTQKGVFENISLEARAGEVIGIAGLVGAGRTEIMRAVWGLDAYSGGEVLVNGKTYKPNSVRAAIDAGIVMATEDRRKLGFVGIRGIRENIALPNLKKLSPGLFLDLKHEKEKVLYYFDRLRIKANSINMEVEKLSGGNQQKVVLAKWLLTDSSVFLLDEPTRGIDVGAKYEIYELMNEMAENGIAVVMISSELPELIGMCDRIYVISEGRMAGLVEKQDMTQENIMMLATGGKESWKNEFSQKIE